MSSETTYPNLGFDPVPGIPENVKSLGTSVSSAVESMATANDLLRRLRADDSSVWQGKAGDAFRSHVDEKLVTNLTNAHESLAKATGVLQDWYGKLVDFQEAAKRLDQQAGEAKAQVSAAETQLSHAQENPDLSLAGQQFSDADQLRAAQQRLDAAENAARAASTKVEEAREGLDAVLRKAMELQDDHERTARVAADQLKDATKDLAPEEPGFFKRLLNSIGDIFSKVGEWIKTHLHDVLSTISGIAGLIAFLTPPPIDLIAIAVSGVAGCGAFGMDVADPNSGLRTAFNDIYHGKFSVDTFTGLLGGALDLASALPVVGVIKEAGQAVKSSANVFEKTVASLSDSAHGGIIPNTFAKQAMRFEGTERAAEAITSATVGNARAAYAIETTASKVTAATNVAESAAASAAPVVSQAAAKVGAAAALAIKNAGVLYSTGNNVVNIINTKVSA